MQRVAIFLLGLIVSGFAEKGNGRGVKVGVALTLKRRFSKSKKMSTSNWKQRRLSTTNSSTPPSKSSTP